MKVTINCSSGCCLVESKDILGLELIEDLDAYKYPYGIVVVTEAYNYCLNYKTKDEAVETYKGITRLVKKGV